MQQFFGPGGPFGRQMPSQPQERMEHGLGSGVIISPDGYIVTNNHVIEGAVDIRVTMSNREVLSAKLIGADPLTDLAVIKVNGTNLPSVPWGNRPTYIPGQTVLGVRQSVWVSFYRDARHRQRAQPSEPGCQRSAQAGGVHSDRRCHQSRELGWRAGGCARRTDRNQYVPDFVVGFVLGNGIRDSDADRRANGGDIDSRRQNQSRVYRMGSRM